MKKGYILPSPMLKPYIDRYWYWETEKNESICFPDIYPASGTEFCLHYKQPFKGYPNSHTLCSRKMNSYKLVQDGTVGFISVRFKSPSFKYFTNIPLDNIKNQILTSYDIWGLKGKIFEDEFLFSNDFNKRIKIIDSFFENILDNGISKNPNIDWAINYIYYNYKNLNISNVINQTNLSTRTFQRRFKESVGVSAKEFHKISRFQSLLKFTLLNKIYPSLGLILDSGYYDQAHFIKDFKTLTGKKPSILIKSNNLAHFYNTSLK